MHRWPRNTSAPAAADSSLVAIGRPQRHGPAVSTARQLAPGSTQRPMPESGHDSRRAQCWRDRAAERAGAVCSLWPPMSPPKEQIVRPARRGERICAASDGSYRSAAQHNTAHSMRPSRRHVTRPAPLPLLLPSPPPRFRLSWGFFASLLLSRHPIAVFVSVSLLLCVYITALQLFGRLFRSAPSWHCVLDRLPSRLVVCFGRRSACVSFSFYLRSSRLCSASPSALLAG